MTKERKYPIYLIEVNWLEKPFTKKKYEPWQLDESGLIKNSTAVEKMFKEPTNQFTAEIFAKGWWNKYAITHIPYRDTLPLFHRHLSQVKIKVTFLEEESWCLTWFSHYTYNTHLTDDELRESFRDFVWRKLPESRILEAGPNSYAYKQARKEEKHLHCLMGAEDTWRWSKPCRCEHCQKAGIVRIDH